MIFDGNFEELEVMLKRIRDDGILEPNCLYFRAAYGGRACIGEPPITGQKIAAVQVFREGHQWLVKILTPLVRARVSLKDGKFAASYYPMSEETGWCEAACKDMDTIEETLGRLNHKEVKVV